MHNPELLMAEAYDEGVVSEVIRPAAIVPEESARAVLVELGMPADKIETKGYGRSKPREAGTTEEAHQQNRRVEFVIESGPSSAPRGGGREGVAPRLIKSRQIRPRRGRAAR